MDKSTLSANTNTLTRKSQIAREYAYQIRDKSPDTWVFWIHAGNAARYDQGFRDIAEYAKIPGRQDAQSNILQLTGDWLRSEKSGKWVIILDNVDDAGFLLDSDAESGSQDTRASVRPGSRVSYLPYCSKGSVLITSRYKTVARSLVESYNIVDVDPMSRDDAMALMEKMLGAQQYHENIEAARALALELEYMPLAIAQAASYISQRAPLVTLERYLEKLQQNDLQKGGLLEYPQDSHLRQDYESKTSILSTWQISFEHIRGFRPSAANLLAVMSFCDRQGIPKELLQGVHKDTTKISASPPQNHAHLVHSKERGFKGFYERLKGRGKRSKSEENPASSIKPHNNTSNEVSASGTSISQTDWSLEEDLHVLQDYSFIHVVENGTMFNMHRLVQLSMQTWLLAQNKQDRWRQSFLSSLQAVLPNGEYENWKIWQIYLPHAKAAAIQKPEDRDSLNSWAGIMCYTGWYLLAIGNAAESEQILLQASSTCTKLYGNTNEYSLRPLILLSHAYLDLRWHKEAKGVLERVVGMCKATLGPTHGMTLTSMSDLGMSYCRLDQYKEAQELLVAALEGGKVTFGDHHPITAWSGTCLAAVHASQGRTGEAEELLIEVIKLQKESLGAEHPMAFALIILAGVYKQQNRLDKAEKLSREILESSIKVLGKDHRRTLQRFQDLGMIYAKQGQWKEAEELIVKAVEGSKRKFGINHITTQDFLFDLAFIYLEQNRVDEEEKLRVAIDEWNGANAEETCELALSNMHRLAIIWYEKGEQSKATMLMKRCYKLKVRVLGREHERTQASAQWLSLYEPGIDLESLGMTEQVDIGSAQRT